MLHRGSALHEELRARLSCFRRVSIVWWFSLLFFFSFFLFFFLIIENIILAVNTPFFRYRVQYFRSNAVIGEYKRKSCRFYRFNFLLVVIAFFVSVCFDILFLPVFILVSAFLPYVSCNYFNSDRRIKR